MSGEPTPRRFAVWAATLVLPLVLAVVAFPTVRRHLGAGGAAAGDPPAPSGRSGPTIEQIEASRASDEAAARALRGWQKVEVLAPREAKAGPDGELVAPFQGFGLSIESTPAGATVRVAGQDLGETPLLTSVNCQPGEPVEVRVERRPLRPQVRTVRCRADALVTVRVTLAR